MKIQLFLTCVVFDETQKIAMKIPVSISSSVNRYHVLIRFGLSKRVDYENRLLCSQRTSHGRTTVLYFRFHVL